MKSITVGRSSSNTISVNDDKASRLHCTIIQDSSGKFTVRDENSTNGTYVNERRISGEQYITVGDTVRVGHTRVAWQSYFGGGYSPTSRRTERVPEQHQPVVVNVNQPPKSYRQEQPLVENTGSGFGITALCTGIVGLFAFGLILGVLAIIFGALSIKRIEKRKGLGIAGLILGIIDVAVYLIILATFGSLFFWSL
ncbi:MAG: FHA domain-containing protein [Prevotellaceae bacterium]|jgi:hypothetical protein|nr:FHA domain-containing protein [Prevotellaceae bacterium]